MSNGQTKEVPVVWNPSTIDTSSVGTKTAAGKVQGYGGKVIFTVEVEAVEVGSVQISLFKDSASSSNKVDFTNIKDFYLVNKKTGKEYRDGKTPSSSLRKNQYEMKDLPVGEYTIHAVFAEGVFVYKIDVGETYKETEYNSDSNPLVIGNGGTGYISLIIKANNTLKEIQPLEDLTVPNDITLDDFKAALPKFATILDSLDNTHQVELKWDVRPFNFDGYKKPGNTLLTSEFFTLPFNVSNTVPANRLEVKLKVIFKEDENSALQLAIGEATKAVSELENLVKNATTVSVAQEAIEVAKAKVDKVKELDASYVTTEWDAIIANEQKNVNQISVVIELINVLPEANKITLDDKVEVESARTAFNGLTEVQKALVTNVANLEAAENSLLIVIEKNTVYYKIQSQTQQHIYVRFSKEHEVTKLMKVRTDQNRLMEISRPYTTGYNSPNHMLFKYDSNVARAGDFLKIEIPFKDGTKVELLLTFNGSNKLWEIEGEFLREE